MFKTYKQDISEYRLQATWNPSSLRKYLALSLEYVHARNEGTYAFNFDYLLKLNSLSSDSTYARYLMSASSADDILAHATLKTPALVIFSGSTSSIGFVPRADFGFGYSLRKADDVQQYVNEDNGGYTSAGILSGAADFLAKDAWVFEGTATFGFYYQVKANHTVILDAGYRDKADISSDSYGTTQKGFYSRLGYTFSW